MKISRLLVCFLASAVGACGGSASSDGGTTGTVSGTVAGATLNAASVLATPTDSSSYSGGCPVNADAGTCTSTTSFTHGIGILITNRASFTCSAVQAMASSGQETAFASFEELGLEVNVLNGDVTAGTYDIVSPEGFVTGAVAFVSATSAACAQTTDVAATTGTVTISQVDGSRVTGTYNVTFGTQGTATGAFDAALCTIDAGTTSGTSKAVCSP